MNFEILDVVALLKNIPEFNLVKGQVGTIVDLHHENNYEVEFTDKKGQTIASLALDNKDLMSLHFELV